MARWRLTAKHYINVIRNGEKTQWVREETSRDTGRVNRKTYFVPTYLDPESPADQNYPDEIVVSYAAGAHPRDLIFEGMPTRDMEPLDDEAMAITAKVKGMGHDPIEDLPAQGDTYAERLLGLLTTQLSNVQAPTPAPTAALEAEIAKLKAENAKLNIALTAKPATKV